MARRVAITGLGPITGLGAGIEANWTGLLKGCSAIGTLRAFDPGGLACRIAAEVADFSVRDYVPKNYRKATKVMARDIELAVAAADLAARDAHLLTKGTAEDSPPSYPEARMGAHIGAGLMAADMDELTLALAEATREGQPTVFDMHRWGQRGMDQLTPLWLLKYLPNMLACHVTIIHDTQGPSNTITCGEASGGLSIGESLRVIQRGAADMCFCGGAESRMNPMAFLRPLLAGRLNTQDNDRPAQALRPLDETAAGTVLGEGGCILVLEALETAQKRPQTRMYAEVIGFGASQTVHAPSRNTEPDPEGRGLALAMRAALREAGLEAAEVDLVVPFGCAVPAFDRAEAQALRTVFGERLKEVYLTPTKPMVGHLGGAGGAFDVAVAAQALRQQCVPATINCDKPLPGLGCRSAPSRPAKLRHALTYCTGVGGQNAALLLRTLRE